MEQELISREIRRNAIYSEWYETPIPLGEPWQGAYYAYGRGGGVLIVTPAKRKVIYAYAG